MFTLNRESLAHELSLLSNAAEKKGTIPILAFLLIEFEGKTAKLTATDLDVFLITRIEAQGEAWSGCVPFKQLHEFVRYLDKSVEAVTFTPKESRIEVKAARSKMVLPIESVDRFPQPDKQPEQSITLDGGWLIPALEAAIVSASVDKDYTGDLPGAYVECANGSLAVVATDKHRLTVSEMPYEANPFKLFLPRPAVAILCKMEAGEITVAHNESVAHITTGARVVIARLLTALFPQWRLVIPKEFKYSVQALTAEIQAAIRRASVTLNRRDTASGSVAEAIHLRFSRESLQVETAESDKGQSEESVNIQSNLNGDSILIGVNKNYLVDALGNVGEQVEISFNDALAQMRVKPLNSDNLTNIVMPCRI